MGNAAGHHCSSRPLLRPYPAAVHSHSAVPGYPAY